MLEIVAFVVSVSHACFAAVKWLVAKAKAAESKIAEEAKKAEAAVKKVL